MPHKKIYQDFLRHAGAIIPDGRGRPDSVVLRRSVSTSYYSVWHCICYAWSSKFSVELQQKIYRHPNHISFKTAAGKIKSNKSQWSDRPCCPDLGQMCEDFMRLQEARHEADYNIFATFQKVDAIISWNRATRFIETFESSGNSSELADGLDCLLLEGMSIKPPSR